MERLEDLLAMFIESVLRLTTLFSRRLEAHLKPTRKELTLRH